MSFQEKYIIASRRGSTEHCSVIESILCFLHGFDWILRVVFDRMVFLANSMYRCLTCLSVTLSSNVKPRIAKESCRLCPTPLGLQFLESLCLGGEGGGF